MYAMVDKFGNVYPNLNQFYMAGLMVSPMIILELVFMKSMYERSRWNTLIMIASLILLVLFWTGIREQIAISDEEFLKSMIPHHAGAILMCEQGSLKDPEIIDLCQNIVSSQQKEIDFMKYKLEEISE
jgi:hypothetical protein